MDKSIVSPLFDSRCRWEGWVFCTSQEIGWDDCWRMEC